MHASELDEIEFYRALEKSGARVLLIGRMAMILRGLPVATADYDLWVHTDDIEKLNDALAVLNHLPNFSAEEARTRGRYVLQNSEHVDVMIARAAVTKKGETVRFDDVWLRRERLAFTEDVHVSVPSIADHIRTKEWSMRAKDIGDIQLLEALKKGDPS